jgi:tetratricopeptide (TPR) repeat protein/predicted aspartyl protease
MCAINGIPVLRGLAYVLSCSLLLAAAPSAAADKKCRIAQLLEFPITMESLRPTVLAQINGRDARFLLDSGAFYSLISAATAATYQLRLQPAPFNFRIEGIGGTTDVSEAFVSQFTIARITVKNLGFFVGGSDISVAGLLGQNFLQRFDVEYDFANGAMRLFHTEGCDHTLLAYWLTPDQPYSSMSIERIDAENPHTVGVAYINGQQIRVQFDSGAYTSLLSLKAAARAGVTPDSPGVVASGYSSGIGRGRVKSLLAPFASFRIGDDEEIKNTKLRIADVDLRSADMLLGADFFVSHRIFVANRERRLYLSYNGGPVFKLSRAAGSAVANVATEPADAAEPAPDAAQTAPTAPTAPTEADPAEIARRGAALTARRDYTPALAALSQAIELSPNEAEFYFERAQAYSGAGQQDLALADFDRAIELKPDYLDAYVPRAELHWRKNDLPAVMADLDAADRLAPKPSDLRYTLAEFNLRLHRLPEAIEQFTLWLPYHRDDSRSLDAFHGRCLCRVLLNQDLPAALSDCNAVLHRADKTSPNYAQILVDRGLIRLREGSYDRAIADFDDALKMTPDKARASYARALYARGIAKARKNQTADSESDIAAATGVAPKIADEFEPYGLRP